MAEISEMLGVVADFIKASNKLIEVSAKNHHVKLVDNYYFHDKNFYKVYQPRLSAWPPVGLNCHFALHFSRILQENMLQFLVCVICSVIYVNV